MLPVYRGQPPGGPHRSRTTHDDSTPWILIMVVLFSGSCLVFTRQRSLAEQSLTAVTTPKETLARQTLEVKKRQIPNPFFDPATHESYLKLPPLPEATHEILKGGWNLTDSVYDFAAHHPAARVLSWDNPRLVQFPSFLSPDEVEHFMQAARDKLQRSEVLSADDGNAVDDSRTSFGAWPTDDEILKGVHNRIHRLLAIPERFGEDFYILSYNNGQKYSAHNDHCMDNIDYYKVADKACEEFLRRAGGPMCGPGFGGPSCGDRVATFILYLKSPTKGGRTVFPMADATLQQVPESRRIGGEDWYCDDPDVLGAAPNAGDGILFWNYVPSNGNGTGSYEDGTANPMARPVHQSMHSGCPVIEGEKWIATRWIRGSGFDYTG